MRHILLLLFLPRGKSPLDRVLSEKDCPSRLKTKIFSIELPAIKQRKNESVDIKGAQLLDHVERQTLSTRAARMKKSHLRIKAKPTRMQM